jgi:hypothetical protein
LSTLTLERPTPGLPANLHVPTELPPNHRGEPLRRLSYSAVNRFQRCPEDFRRSYILGEWGPKSGAMFIGSRVDDTLTSFYRHQLDGTPLDLAATVDLYDAIWRTELERERARSGPVRWEAGLGENAAHALGLQALKLSLQEIVPRLGRPVAVQRRFSMKIDPQLDWSIVGIVDLDTIRRQTVYMTRDGREYPQLRDHGSQEPTIAVPYMQAPPEFQSPLKRGRGATLTPSEAIDTFNRESALHEEQHALWVIRGEDGPPPKPAKPLPEIAVPVRALAAEQYEREVSGITDYKVSTSARSEHAASSDLQASIYLGERWLAGDPAFDFRFAQILKPKDGRRATMSSSLVATRRAPYDLRTVFMRIAQTANQIWALYNQLGPDRPWGWPNEEWRCRFCTYGPHGSGDCPFSLAA